MEKPKAVGFRSKYILIALAVVCIALALIMSRGSSRIRKTPLQIAEECTTATEWMMVCDTQEHVLTLFKQSKDAAPGEWKPVMYNSFPCSTGALRMINGEMKTCTPLGPSYIKFKQRSHKFDDCKSWYNCWMKGGFAIHSTMYARDEDLPLHETDSRLGDNISTSCIRVDLKVAKFIYKTMPEMTPLMVY